MVALAGGVVSASSPAWARQPRPDPEPEPPEVRYVPGEIVVSPHDPFDSNAIAQRLRENGFRVLGQGAMSGMILASSPIPILAPGWPGLEEALCQWIKAWPEVKAAERNVGGDALGRQPTNPCPPLNNYTSNHCNQAFPTNQIQGNCRSPPPAGHPDDPTFCRQWGLYNPGGQTVVDLNFWRDLRPTHLLSHLCWSQTAVAGIDINLLPAWQRTTGSSQVAVAIIDSGIEDCNPDFDPDRFLPGLAYNCPGNDNYANPCCPSELTTPCDFMPATDNFGHGTFVASIIGAVADNGIGMKGIDQHCKLVSIRALNSGTFAPPTPLEANYARVTLALEEIATNPVYASVRVINCSFNLEPIPPYPEARPSS